MAETVEELRHLLFQVANAISNPDRDHVGRCVDVSLIIGSAERWRPQLGREVKP